MAIDRKRYEGRTCGCWMWQENGITDGYSGIASDDGVEVLYPQCCNDGDYGLAWFEEVSEPDANLLVDGPILLDECDRLQGKLDSLIEACEAAKMVLSYASVAPIFQKDKERADRLLRFALEDAKNDL